MSLVELDVRRFVRELASDAPAPGGGSVAALCGALGAALCAMVARLTEGREKYRDHWDDMASVRAMADALADRLLELVDKDTQAYNRVTAAFRMPKTDDDQKAVRAAAIEEATKEAARIPLETLEAVAEIGGLAGAALEKGNPNCLTDAGVAVHLMRAAANGAAYNVRINLVSIQDETFRIELAAAVERILDRVLDAAKRLEARVERGLA